MTPPPAHPAPAGSALVAVLCLTLLTGLCALAFLLSCPPTWSRRRTVRRLSQAALEDEALRLDVREGLLLARLREGELSRRDYRSAMGLLAAQARGQDPAGHPRALRARPARGRATSGRRSPPLE